MSWNSIIGQERVKLLLRRSIEKKQIAHAYVFYGIEGVGKDALALEFAKTLHCTAGTTEACGICYSCKKHELLQHANLKLIFPLPVGKSEKQGDDPISCLTEDQVNTIREQIHMKAKDPYGRIEIPKANFIKINSVREIKRESSMTQFEEGKKIFLILNADLMNTEASNSLLKTLEEPLEDTILLLTTSHKDQLLMTILSRCQHIRCESLQDSDITSALIEREGTSPDQAALAARLANGSYGFARRIVSSDAAAQRDEVVDFIRLSLSKNKTNVLTTIEELAAAYDRIALQRWIEILQTWLREALMLQTTRTSTGLAWDQQSLTRFITNFPRADIFSAVEMTNQAIAQIDKNAYLPLVLINLSAALRRTITRSY